MREEQVVCVPVMFMLSLNATGTPASGPSVSNVPSAMAWSTRCAAAMAASEVTSRNACT